MRRLTRHGVGERRLREETRYLRAFVVYYSMLAALGTSPSGCALRTAFMGAWDKAARESPEKMRAYDTFFNRIRLYAECAPAGVIPAIERLADEVSGRFADLLDARNDASLRKWSAPFAAACRARTSLSAGRLLRQSSLA